MSTPTARTLIIFALIFIATASFAIYPSFVSSPGVDCLAGCAVGKGFPMPYVFTHRGGVVGGSTNEQIYYQALAIDIAFLLLVSTLATWVIKKLIIPRK